MKTEVQVLTKIGDKLGLNRWIKIVIIAIVGVALFVAFLLLLVGSVISPHYPNSELVSFNPPSYIYYSESRQLFIEFHFVYESPDSLDEIYDWYRSKYNIPSGNLLLRDNLYFDNSSIRVGHSLELFSQQPSNIAEFTHAHVILIDLDPLSLDYYLPK